ncbi:PREDICTED: uncharacterized protein LOC104738474 [Camelina sativa]|uniref:ATP-dependent DNA helicase n=1 Tax=Camelina sativa TaxID=90675 RepID=A0ABM0VIZ1_CAMSA|nr:PREDICTED: uncharacterized protein LOC104738474 [Camelina sativa]
MDEFNYNREDLAKKHVGWKKMLTEEQKKIYDEIMEAVINDKGGVFFLYGFGGTWKTFLWKVLSATIRSNGHIVLNTTSSGIASLLLEGARTAHSRYALPLNPNETSTCNMSRSSELAEERIYLSSDSIDPQDKRALKNKVYSPDFLNTIKVSGIPCHRLRLKIGCPIMLMRNIDPHGGLMNGTRLQITQMADHVLQARILTGTRVGKIVLIPRMLISPSDARLPFKMRRRQFPVSVALAMTINKSQGQSLEKFGIYLPRPVFSHGQLYVAMSRVKSKSGLKMLITDSEGKPQTKTTNIVFKEVFQNLH